MKTKSPEANRTPSSPPFILSYWVGPPAEETTLARYREIADCGFNVVLTFGESVALNRKVLDLCQATGLKAWVGDLRLNTPPDVPFFTETLNNVILDYGQHPALAGYYLGDEPHASLFPRLGAINQYLLRHDLRRLPYINLFPTYAKSALLGTRTYEIHIEQYIKIVKPALLSWDHYALLKDGERKDYFQNLEIVRRLCLQAHLPFMQTILVTPHRPYRNVTEIDLNWQVFTSLCYGVSGISYFTYWSLPGWKDGIISAEGRQTDYYDIVRRLNGRINALAPTLVKLHSKGVYHTRPLPHETIPVAEAGLLKALEGKNLLLGWFQNRFRKDFFFVVNRSLRKPCEARLIFRRNIRRASEIRQTDGELSSIKMKFNQLEISLEPGEGRLVCIQ